MKKYYLLFIMFCGLFACSNEELIEKDVLENKTKESLNLTRQAADGKYDLLGFSYDITKEYLSVEAAPRTVIDVEKFVKDNPTRYYDPGTHKGLSDTYAGATFKDMLEEVKTKTNFKTSANWGAFGGHLDVDTEEDRKHTFSSKYSYSRTDMYKRIKGLYLDADLELLLKYVHPVFYENLERLSPDEFVKEYGTHVMTDITIGGRLTFLYRSVITAESDSSRKKIIVKAGSNFSFGQFGANVDGSYENETTKKNSEKNSSWHIWVSYHGGTDNGLTQEFDSEKGLSKTTFNSSRWEASVSPSNAALIAVNWDKAYPIYEFITDPVKKAEIKAAIERYIKIKNIKEEEGLSLQLLSRIHNNHSKNTFTVLGSEADEWLRKSNAYTRDGLLGFVPIKKQPGSTPLYRVHTNVKNGDTFDVWGKDNLNKFLEAKTPFLKRLYIHEADLGYTYNKKESNTIPLYSVHNEKSKNTFTVAGDDELTYWLRQGSHYKKIADLGYIYPVK